MKLTIKYPFLDFEASVESVDVQVVLDTAVKLLELLIDLEKKVKAESVG